MEAEFDGSLSADGAEKAAEFVQFCDAFNIPVLTLTNVSGFTASKYDEKRIAKSAAKLTYAFADATVPKVNVVIGKAFGSAYVTMNSKAVGADMVYAWPDAEIGMMDANQQLRSCMRTLMQQPSERKQQNTRICSQAHYQQRKEDMWIRSSKQQIQENM